MAIKPAIIISAALIILSFNTNAQEDSLSKRELAEVVVTSQFRPQSVKNSVYQVRVINNDRIRLSGATNVQQVLNTQLGFRFTNDNTLGTTDVELLGMSGRNVKILLDGVPLIDRGDTRESLGQVDLNTIERIEIVEGPMSVSYGSDALAGVINLITKKPGKSLLSVNARIQEESAGDEYYPFSYQGVHFQSLGLSFSKKRWSVSAGGTHNDFNGYGGDAYGRAKSWRPKEQFMGNARLGYHSNAIDLYYRFDGLNEEILNRGPINMNAYTAVDQSYITHRLMHQVQNQWKINGRMQLNSILSYTDYNRTTSTTIKDFVAGTSVPGTQPGQQDESIFKSFLFRNNFNYTISDRISLQPGFEYSSDKATGARIEGEPVINDFALFASAEWKPTKNINIRPGLRFIKNSVYDAPPVIPAINTKWALNENFDLRLAYAYGFRSPALRELYFNFIDANHIIIGNPNLKAEHSNSFNGSVNWTPKDFKAGKFTSVLGGFYNVFDDLISYANSPTSNDTTITVNISRYKTTGVTFENTLLWKNLTATLGFSYIGRYNELSDDAEYKAESLPEFVWAPEVNTNLSYTLKRSKTAFAFYYKYTGERPGYVLTTNSITNQQELVLNKIEAFHMADFTITQPFLKLFTLTTGVKNIFNVTNLANSANITGGAHGGGGSQPMSYGRSFFLGLSFQWNKS